MALKSRAQRLLLAYLLYEVSKPRVSTRKFEDLQRKLKYAGMTGGASAYTLETHGNAYHSPDFHAVDDVFEDAQYPNAVLLDGSRAMTGDLVIQKNYAPYYGKIKFQDDAGVQKVVLRGAYNQLVVYRNDDLDLGNVLCNYINASYWQAQQTTSWLQTKNVVGGKIQFLTSYGGAQICARFESLGSNNGAFIIDRAGDITMLANKTFTFSVGTKHDGLIVKPAAEVQTTDATQTTVDSLTLLDENTYHVEAEVVGVKSDGSQRASYHLACTAYRTGAGNATLQGAITSLHTQESDANWDATFTVNGNDLRVSVTGVAATTVEWGCTMLYLNMSN